MKSKTDWKRIADMKDEDIDFSDIPELGDEFFKRAILIIPTTIKQTAKDTYEVRMMQQTMIDK